MRFDERAGLEGPRKKLLEGQPQTSLKQVGSVSLLRLRRVAALTASAAVPRKCEGGRGVGSDLGSPVAALP